MPWLEIRLHVSAEHVETLSDAMLESGALSASIEDADAGTRNEHSLFDEPGTDAGARTSRWGRNTIAALVPGDADPDALLAQAARAVGLECPEYTLRRIEDADWVRQTQAQFPPLKIGERLWVVPNWHPVPADARGVVVRLDPGMAFGTGSHPTTQLVLIWLERTVTGGERLLDYGCGSGILAVTAARLGAATVHATDIDPAALQCAADNARANAVAVQVFAPDALPAGPYDVVVANILANPLIMLAPLIAERTRAKGRIALSGILDAQTDAVCDACRPWFDVQVSASREGWALLEGVRK